MNEFVGSGKRSRFPVIDGFRHVGQLFSKWVPGFNFDSSSKVDSPFVRKEDRQKHR
jgi:hypothetical protein